MLSNCNIRSCVATIVAAFTLIFIATDVTRAADAKSALAKKGLVQTADGKMWELQKDEAELAKQLEELDKILTGLSKFEGDETKQGIQAEFEAFMKLKKEKEDHLNLEGAVLAYRGFGDKSEVDKFNNELMPAYQTFVQEGQAKLLNEDGTFKVELIYAERAARVKAFSDAFTAVDKTMAAIQKKYRGLKRDPKVIEAASQAGGRIGPGGTLGRMRSRIKDVSAQAQKLNVTISQVKFAKSLFDTELDNTIVRGIDPEKEPVKYLKARNFKKSDDIWLLKDEALLPAIMEQASDFEQRVKKAKSGYKPRTQKKLEQEKMRHKQLVRLLDKEQDAIKKKVVDQGWAVTAGDISSIHDWQKKKRKEVLYSWKIRDAQEALNNASDKLANARADRAAFLRRAVDQMVLIAERYGELADDEDLMTALEAAGEGLGPTKSFESQYGKLKRSLRKAEKEVKSSRG